MKKTAKPRYVVTKTRWRFGNKYFRGAKSFVQYSLQQLSKSRSGKTKAVYDKIMASRAIARHKEGKPVNWTGAAKSLVANLPTICVRATVKSTKPTRVRSLTGRELAAKLDNKGRVNGVGGRIPSQRMLDRG